MIVLFTIFISIYTILLCFCITSISSVIQTYPDSFKTKQYNFKYLCPKKFFKSNIFQTFQQKVGECIFVYQGSPAYMAGGSRSPTYLAGEQSPTYLAGEQSPTYLAKGGWGWVTYLPGQGWKWVNSAWSVG